jgi:penicillin-binding protein 2
MKKNRQNKFFAEYEGHAIKQSSRWTEETLFRNDHDARQISTGAFTSSSVRRDRYKNTVMILITVFFLLILRILYLQIVGGGAYRLVADNNRQRIIPIPSSRGLIYDRHMRPLTENVPQFSLAVIPQDIPRNQADREIAIERLAYITQKSPADIGELFDKYGAYSYDSIVIEDDIDYETALNLYIAASDLPGIHILRGSKRLYLTNLRDDDNQVMEDRARSLSHLIGYQGKLNQTDLNALYVQGYHPSDVIGKSGIEKTYEALLRGIYGSRRIEVNAVGRQQAILAEDPPVGGKHVVLSIDLHMQEALQRFMQEQLDLGGQTRAAGIVLDPRNGDILAMVSLPDYDNNHFSGGISIEQYNQYIQNENKPLFNRAIAGTYPSGSTIKPAIAMAALEENVISERATVLSTGGIQVGPWFFPDWQAGGHGRTTVRSSLAWSVNTFYYYIGGGFKNFSGLGVETMTKYLRNFGFAEVTGVDIPGEASGFLPSKEWKVKTKGERWYVGDTYNLSIGQGDTLVTPLQIASFTGAIANGGVLYRPSMVHGFVDPLTSEQNAIDPNVIRQYPIDKKYIRVVSEGMRECVTYGSCRRLSYLPFSIAGKTGTAQWSQTKEDHAWFTSYAPFENPEIVVTILVEEGIGGSTSATPIADAFYRWWWEYRKSQP